jgi:hypothetical protein
MKSEFLESSLVLRSALLALQKELLAYLKETFEKESARPIAPAEWLQVIMASERFAWLKELSSLIIDIDMLSELPDVTAEQLSTARLEVERLFFDQDATSEFSKHYRQLILAGAPLLLTHGELRHTVHALPPVSANISPEKALLERKSWQEEHRLSRKRRP